MSPQFGKQDISAEKLGLQKKAIDCRAGVSPPASLIILVVGATTRCSVDRSTSLLHRARRSPMLTTMVSGYILKIS